jgi:hypothetical protein
MRMFAMTFQWEKVKGSAREKQNFRKSSGNFASLKYYPKVKE